MSQPLSQIASSASADLTRLAEQLNDLPEADSIQDADDAVRQILSAHSKVCAIIDMMSDRLASSSSLTVWRSALSMDNRQYGSFRALNEWLGSDLERSFSRNLPDEDCKFGPDIVATDYARFTGKGLVTQVGTRLNPMGENPLKVYKLTLFGKSFAHLIKDAVEQTL